jgi:cell pole-organizing protein PopZ
MQQEEIEAFLAELGSDSADAADVLADSTEPIPTAESLPEPEFATSDHVVQPTSDEDEEEQSRTELEQELERAIASRPMRTQPEPQAQVPRYAQRLHEPEISDEALISANTTAAVNSAFNTLAQTVLVQNGRTLEDLVREMLRPMLKVWLDDNLPGMVERLVRAEIERVSRGRV